MLKIGDFSKLSRISIRMLRHYDDMDLLKPQMIDDMTNYRYYTEDQLQRANRIMALKQMGFSLSTIRELLISYDNPQALADYLKVKRFEVQSQAEEIEHRLQLLDSALERLREDETAMNYDVTIKTLEKRSVASVRKVIMAYDHEQELWDIMMKETKDQVIQLEEPCYSLAIFHDEGYKEEDVDVEIQMSVKGNYKDTAHVVFKDMPAVQYASAILKGSYEMLTDVNRKLAEWVKDNHYAFNGAMFCIYHVSPADTPNPDEWVTEICYPVKKKA